MNHGSTNASAAGAPDRFDRLPREAAAAQDLAAAEAAGDARVPGRPVVWIVSELYWPETTSTGGVLTAIAEGLAATHDVRVICGQPSYSQRGTRAPAREVRGGVRIRRAAGTTLDKNVIPFRLANAATLGTSMLAHALASFRRGDCVIVVTTPPTLPPVVAAAAKAKGARCVLLLHDVYPDVLVASGMARPGSAVVRVGEAVMRQLYRAVPRIVAIGRDMAELAARKLGGDARRISVIPNFADLSTIRPLPRAENPLLNELGIADKFVVQVAGNMGRTHGIETLCEAALKMRGDPDVHFLVIGSGGKKPMLEAFVERHGLTNVTVLGPRPREEHNVFLNACDVALILFVKGMFGISVPSRSYSTLGAGKPIIAAMDPRAEIARVVAEEEIGWVAGEEDADAVVRAIREAKADPERLAAMSRRARAVAERDYALEAVVEQFRRLVDDVARGG